MTNASSTLRGPMKLSIAKLIAVPMAMMPTREVLIVAGSEDEEGLGIVFALAGRRCCMRRSGGPKSATRQPDPSVESVSGFLAVRRPPAYRPRVSA